VVRRRHAQGSVFDLILPDGEKLWTPALRRIDKVLDDEVLLGVVEEALVSRRARSRRWGRLGRRRDAGADSLGPLRVISARERRVPTCPPLTSTACSAPP